MDKPFWKFRFDYHAVWNTKYREKCLIGLAKEKLINHIRQNAREKGIFVHALNGGDDHMHLVFRLPKHLTIEKVMQLVKGESAYWANKEKIFPTKLKWQKDYFAEAVKPEKLVNVIRYVERQEAHHKIFTSEEEMAKIRAECEAQEGINLKETPLLPNPSSSAKAEDSGG